MDSALHQRQCQACEGNVPKLSLTQAQEQLKRLAPHWRLNTLPLESISARLSFRNYYETMAFVNALAWIAHQQNHHPDIQFSYRECTVSWTTYAAAGLTINDFICAAKTDQLLATPATPEQTQ